MCVLEIFWRSIGRSLRSGRRFGALSRLWQQQQQRRQQQQQQPQQQPADDRSRVCGVCPLVEQLVTAFNRSVYFNSCRWFCCWRRWSWWGGEGGGSGWQSCWGLRHIVVLRANLWNQIGFSIKGQLECWIEKRGHSLMQWCLFIIASRPYTQIDENLPVSITQFHGKTFFNVWFCFYFYEDRPYQCQVKIKQFNIAFVIEGVVCLLVNLVMTPPPSRRTRRQEQQIFLHFI